MSKIILPIMFILIKGNQSMESLIPKIEKTENIMVNGHDLELFFEENHIMEKYDGIKLEFKNLTATRKEINQYFKKSQENQIDLMLRMFYGDINYKNTKEFYWENSLNMVFKDIINIYKFLFPKFFIEPSSFQQEYHSLLKFHNGIDTITKDQKNIINNLIIQLNNLINEINPKPLSIPDQHSIDVYKKQLKNFQEYMKDIEILEELATIPKEFHQEIINEKIFIKYYYHIFRLKCYYVHFVDALKKYKNNESLLFYDERKDKLFFMVQGFLRLNFILNKIINNYSFSFNGQGKELANLWNPLVVKIFPWMIKVYQVKFLPYFNKILYYNLKVLGYIILAKQFKDLLPLDNNSIEKLKKVSLNNKKFMDQWPLMPYSELIQDNLNKYFNKTLFLKALQVKLIHIVRLNLKNYSYELKDKDFLKITEMLPHNIDDIWNLDPLIGCLIYLLHCPWWQDEKNHGDLLNNYMKIEILLEQLGISLANFTIEDEDKPIFNQTFLNKLTDFF